MICGNCGYQNKAGDEFCGSCGQFLAWTGAPADDTRAAAAAGALGAGPRPGAPGEMAADSPTVVVPPPGSAAAPPPPPPPVAADPSINWPAGLQRCDVCGTANELSRTFCLNCGARLKRAGTTTSAALAVAAAQEERRRGTRMVLYVIGGVILFLLAAGAAFIALGGLSPAATPGPATPVATLVAANPSASGAPLVSAPAGSGRLPSDQPLPTIAATGEPPATAEASIPVVTLPPATLPATLPPATVPPATTPPVGGFVCAPSTFSAAQPGNWRIFHAHWSRKGLADTLYLEMQPISSTETAAVDANILPPDQVQTTYGVPGPASGDVAVVLAFNDAVGLITQFGSPVGYRSLQEFQIYRSAGRVFVVMGVNGAGCYGLSSDAWTGGSTAAPELVVALQR